MSAFRARKVLATSPLRCRTSGGHTGSVSTTSDLLSFYFQVRSSAPWTSLLGAPVSILFCLSSTEIQYSVANHYLVSVTGRRLTIDHVPDIALLDIFDFYQEMTNLCHFGWPWHNIAQVCRRWRELVFSTPKRLQMHIYLTHRSSIPQILHHLPPLPLTIDCRAPHEFDEDIERIPWSTERLGNVALALEQADRIQDVRLLGSDAELRALLAQMIQPARQLETLDIEVLSPSQILPVNFLGGASQSLRHVWLRNVIPPLPSAPCLTDLHYSFAEFATMDIPVMESLLQGLRSMPLLQSLKLDIRSVSEGHLPSSGPRISLTSLSELSFDGSSAQLDTLLQGIEAPSLGALLMELYDDFAVSIPSLPRFLQSSPRLLVPVPVYVSLMDISGCINVRRTESLHQGTISLRVWHCNDETLDTLMASMAAACRCLAPTLSLSKMLVVDRDDGYGDFESLEDPWERWLHHTPGWHAILSAFTNATEVYVENVFTMAIAQTLREPDSAGLLPALRDLHLLFGQFDGFDQSKILAELAPFVDQRNTHDRCVIIHPTTFEEDSDDGW
ncbi:hypothetical protein BC834DRAFT_974661 [Gloeopeniophorella convolvens]|nr:hypothetical protein BC834DRAFT_974661 [Gloeopeniophorella convolvens]